jgi:uncharacterized membrane protein YphA (DoxX/SURF4 family)
MTTIATGVEPPSHRLTPQHEAEPAHGAPTLAELAQNLWLQLKRPEVGLDLLRIYLGAGLTARGVLLLTSPALFARMLNESTQWASNFLVAHIVAGAHLAGGLLLMLGCCTRFAAAIQIPSLAGAVFVLHWREGLMSRNQSLEFAALVLVMLVVFVLCGAGPWSVDRAIEQPAKNEPRPLEALRFANQAALEAEQLARDEAMSLSSSAEGKAEQWLPAAEEDDNTTPPLPRRTKLRLAYVMACTASFVVLMALQHFGAAAAVLLTGAVAFGIWVTGRPNFEC